MLLQTQKQKKKRVVARTSGNMKQTCVQNTLETEDDQIANQNPPYVNLQEQNVPSNICISLESQLKYSRRCSKYRPYSVMCEEVH
jgi:hypothetical protein